MMTTTAAAKSKMPKGGRKGGAVYPRVPLAKALEYAAKLVSKTHTGPQTREIVGPGVFGTAGTGANERISALRQFELLLGTDKDGYQASPFAKKLVGAAEDKPALLREACLKPAVFAKLHKTFLGDTISKGKIRQQILSLNVHPDSADECLTVTIDSMVHCGLWQKAGDDSFAVSSDQQTAAEMEIKEGGNEGVGVPKAEDELPAASGLGEAGSKTGPESTTLLNRSPVRSKANVEIKIDPSMDPEKLERLLGVLRKYGQV